MIEPLDSFIDRASVDMADFYEGLLVNAQVDDEYYGIPYLPVPPSYI